MISLIKLLLLERVFCFSIVCITAAPPSSNVKNILDIVVIGAGASGLASAKNAIEQGHNVDIFEKTGVLGGVWFYTDETGKDEYGVEIHTPMYMKLR